MNLATMMKVLRELHKAEMEIYVSKGKEYSGDANAFANFERAADNLGLHPITVLLVYLSKHFDSICTFVKTKKVHSNEDITGRLMDARNYLGLLYAMVDEYRKLPPDHRWHIEAFAPK